MDSLASLELLLSVCVTGELSELFQHFHLNITGNHSFHKQERTLRYLASLFPSVIMGSSEVLRSLHSSNYRGIHYWYILV